MFTVQYILHIVLNVSHLLPVWLKFCSVSQLKYSCRSQINPVRCVGSWSWSQVSWCFTAGVHTGEQDSDPDPLYRLLPVPRAIRGPAHRPGHAPPSSPAHTSIPPSTIDTERRGERDVCCCKWSQYKTPFEKQATFIYIVISCCCTGMTLQWMFWFGPNRNTCLKHTWEAQTLSWLFKTFQWASGRSLRAAGRNPPFLYGVLHVNMFDLKASVMEEGLISVTINVFNKSTNISVWAAKCPWSVFIFILQII